MNTYVAQTGLDTDVLNIWSPYYMHHWLRDSGIPVSERIKDAVVQPVQHYLEYMKTQHHKTIGRYRRVAKPGPLQAFDAVVDEFNHLTLDERINTDRFRSFAERCKTIVLGSDPKLAYLDGYKPHDHIGRPRL
jgi:hypothetical protein